MPKLNRNIEKLIRKVIEVASPESILKLEDLIRKDRPATSTINRHMILGECKADEATREKLQKDAEEFMASIHDVNDMIAGLQRLKDEDGFGYVSDPKGGLIDFDLTRDTLWYMWFNHGDDCDGWSTLVCESLRNKVKTLERWILFVEDKVRRAHFVTRVVDNNDVQYAFSNLEGKVVNGSFKDYLKTEFHSSKLPEFIYETVSA